MPKKSANYRLGGMNDPIENFGCVLHELVNTAQCWSHPFLWHVTMVKDWITVQYYNKCKGEFSCDSSSGCYPFIQLFHCSFHMKMD
jgi:hypothetical protein